LISDYNLEANHFIKRSEIAQIQGRTVIAIERLETLDGAWRAEQQIEHRGKQIK
jgi:hypothetical protein